MKKIISVAPQHQFASHPKLTMFNKMTLIPLASAALLVSGCGGGSGSSGSSQSGTSTAPLLQVGMQAQYVGSATQTVVGTSAVVNYSLAYTFTKIRSVLQAPANAPAPFDVRSVYTYTVTQDPKNIGGPISKTVDDYENLITSGGTQATSTSLETETYLTNDGIANNSGGGPYTETTISNFTYTNPTPGLPFPLQIGATRNAFSSYTSTYSFNEANASGQAPAGNLNFSYNGVVTQNSDGSKKTQISFADGSVMNSAINSNGSASFSSTGANKVSATIGAPALANGAYTIPVNYSVTLPTPSNSNFAVSDWYPGNGAAPAPLSSETQTVIGPVTTLPASCNGALVQSNMVEVDTSESILNPMSGVTVTKTQNFNANGIAVCTLTQTVFSNYNIYTGSLIGTTTTQTTTLLKTVVSAN